MQPPQNDEQANAGHPASFGKDPSIKDEPKAFTKPMSHPQMISRQQRRHRERQLIRNSMSKAERQVWVRMPKPLKREIYHETLRMIVDQFMHSQHNG